MATEVIMPALGMAQDTGILLRWLKQPGDQVSRGDLIMEVETDKATVEIEATASGILANVNAQEGDEIPVGQVIALLLGPGESAPASPATQPPAGPISKASGDPVSAKTDGNGRSVSPVAARAAARHKVDLAQVKTAGDRVVKADVLAHVERISGPRAVSAYGLILASPKARRLAVERGLELGQISGSGPDGAVLASDVLSVSTQSQPDALILASESTSQTLEVSNAWRVMAERLIQSWTTVPHFYLVREVDATGLMSWRNAVKDRYTEKITVTDLLVKVVAAALKEHPRVNSSWVDGTIQVNEAINIGLAVATDNGLVVPVLHDAHLLRLPQIARRRVEVVERAQSSKLKLDDLQGGSFTISNLGMFGIDAFSAIVNPPQAAILAVGRIADRVVAVNKQIEIRPMMVLTLSADHRVIDGARGAQFMNTLTGLFEEPLKLLD
jgi:pyruvate dehydrogenase E2 component (dihydrolipoamide acetyltransferase)